MKRLHLCQVGLSSFVVFLALGSGTAQAAIYLQEFACGPVTGTRGQALMGSSRFVLRCAIDTSGAIPITGPTPKGRCELIEVSGNSSSSFAQTHSFQLIENQNTYNLIEGRLSLVLSNYHAPLWHQAKISTTAGASLCFYPAQRFFQPPYTTGDGAGSQQNSNTMIIDEYFSNLSLSEQDVEMSNSQ